MAEYIEREALKFSLNSLLFMNKRNFTIGDFESLIDVQPKADVVEVVRCKDCKHRYVPTRCALWYAQVGDTEYFVERGDDFYCSYGEAKTDGKGEGE